METLENTNNDCQMSCKLKIANKRDLHQFLREMLPEFVGVVDPRESGLLDSLYAASLITETDNDSLSGKHVFTRKAQARKLLLLFHKLPVDDFLTKVAPEICAKFPHIIPRVFIASHDQDTIVKEKDHGNDECLRHSIQSRVRSTTMADMLYHGGFLDFESYEYIVSSNTAEMDSIWTTIFEAFLSRTEEEAERLQDLVKKMLQRHTLHIPHDVSDVMSRGMPCTCQYPNAVGRPPKSADQPAQKVNSWLTTSRFSLNRSSGSSRTRVDISTASPPSSPNHAGDTLSLRSSGSSTTVANIGVSNSLEPSGCSKKSPSDTMRHRDPQNENEHPGEIMPAADPHNLKEHPCNTVGNPNPHVSDIVRHTVMPSLDETVPDMVQVDIEPSVDTSVFIPDENAPSSYSNSRADINSLGNESAEQPNLGSSRLDIYFMSGERNSQYSETFSHETQRLSLAYSKEPRKAFHGCVGVVMDMFTRRCLCYTTILLFFSAFFIAGGIIVGKICFVKFFEIAISIVATSVGPSLALPLPPPILIDAPK